MSCVGDGKCMKLCKDINVCLINYDHEISSNYTRFCKTKCEHEMCFECLFDINDDIVHCPFCRTEIDFKRT